MLNSFKRQSHKMVKHTQTIRQQSVFDHFVKLALKGLKLEPKFGENALLALVFNY